MMILLTQIILRHAISIIDSILYDYKIQWKISNDVLNNNNIFLPEINGETAGEDMISFIVLQVKQ